MLLPQVWFIHTQYIFIPSYTFFGSICTHLAFVFWCQTNLQNSQETTCARASFLLKLHEKKTPGTAVFLSILRNFYHYSFIVHVFMSWFYRDVLTWDPPIGFRESVNGVFSLREIVNFVFPLREIVNLEVYVIPKTCFFSLFVKKQQRTDDISFYFYNLNHKLILIIKLNFSIVGNFIKCFISGSYIRQIITTRNL